MTASSPGSAISSDRRAFPARLFLDKDEPRLRTAWRILVHAFLVLLATLTASLGVFFAAPVFSAVPFDFLGPLPALLGITLATVLARRWVDKRSFTSLGFHFSPWTIQDLAFGTLLSGLLMTVIFLVEAAAGWIHITGNALQHFTPLQAALLLADSAWLYIAVGFSEELLSRGYQMQNLREGTNTPWGAILSSGIFGLLHTTNPSATLASTLGVAFAGIFLAYAWVRTRQMWLSIGLHVGWNFFEGTVFGFPVSGLGGFHLVEQVPTGPALLTGGAFGPEAGLILLPLLVLGMLCIRQYTCTRLAA
ncbi:MAG: CPBP family intramembrane metalloprotease [Anaerolineales bacterium]|nr:CPBP family intramembrane metalloprotease [Anaerolineales bacterium]